MNSTRQKITRFRRNKLNNKYIKPQKAMWKCNLKYIKSNLYFAFIYLPVSKRKLIQLIILGE